MSYRKLKADHLFDGFEIFATEKVLILNKDNSIEDIVEVEDAGGDIEEFPGIITPGFVNAHCHLELSHMKGLIPKGTGLVDFVFNIVSHRHVGEELQESIDQADENMYKSGISIVGDICNNASTLPRKSKSDIKYFNFIEASGWLPSVAQNRFERSKEIYDAFRKISDHVSIIPHAPYSVSNALWKLITPYFTDTVLSIHNQETSSEDEFFMQGTGDLQRMYNLMNIRHTAYVPSGKSSLQTHFNKLRTARSVILVHNTFTSGEDISHIKNEAQNQLVSLCLCVNANKYIENTLPDVEMLHQSGLNIILGTDSLASNDALDMVSEMKTIQSNFPSITLQEILRWATINGARSFQLENEYGRFMKGTKPGVTLITGLQENRLTKDSVSMRLA